MSNQEIIPAALDTEIQTSHQLKDEIMEKVTINDGLATVTGSDQPGVFGSELTVPVAALAAANNAVVERTEVGQLLEKTLDDNPTLKQNVEEFRATDHGEAFDKFDLGETEAAGDETFALAGDPPTPNEGRGVTDAVSHIDCSGLAAPWTKVITLPLGQHLIHCETGEQLSAEETKKMYEQAQQEYVDATQPETPRKTTTVATIGAGPSLGHAFAAGMGAQVIEKVKEAVDAPAVEKEYGPGETKPQPDSKAQWKKRKAEEHNNRHKANMSRVEHPYPVLSVRVNDQSREIIVDVKQCTASHINNDAKLGKYIMCTPTRAWGATRMKLLPRANQNMLGGGKALTPAFCDFIIGLLDETVGFEVRHNRLRAENAKSYRFQIEEHIWVKEGFATETNFTL